MENTDNFNFKKNHVKENNDEWASWTEYKVQEINEFNENEETLTIANPNKTRIDEKQIKNTEEENNNNNEEAKDNDFELTKNKAVARNNLWNTYVN